MKSSAARLHDCQAWRAARRPISCSAATKLAPGSSEIHPVESALAFAAQLIGIEPPPEIPYAEAAKAVTPFALSFYDGCIRARNGKLKAALGVTLRYPNYRQGLRALYEAGDHLAAPTPTAPAE